MRVTQQSLKFKRDTFKFKYQLHVTILYKRYFGGQRRAQNPISKTNLGVETNACFKSNGLSESNSNGGLLGN